jgi:hypothetical protein
LISKSGYELPLAMYQMREPVDIGMEWIATKKSLRQSNYPAANGAILLGPIS